MKEYRQCEFCFLMIEKIATIRKNCGRTSCVWCHVVNEKGRQLNKISYCELPKKHE